MADAEHTDAEDGAQQKLRDNAAKAQAKAVAAKALASEKAQDAGLEPQGLEPQDPDSHIMNSAGNLLQGYNGQATVGTPIGSWEQGSGVGKGRQGSYVSREPSHPLP